MNLQQLQDKVTEAYSAVASSGFKPEEVVVEFNTKVLTDGPFPMNDIEFSFDIFNPTVLKAIIN